WSRGSAGCSPSGGTTAGGGLPRGAARGREKTWGVTGRFSRGAGGGWGPCASGEAGGGRRCAVWFWARGWWWVAWGGGRTGRGGAPVGAGRGEQIETGTRLGINPYAPPPAQSIKKQRDRGRPPKSARGLFTSPAPISERNSGMSTEVASTEYGVIIRYDD